MISCSEIEAKLAQIFKGTYHSLERVLVFEKSFLTIDKIYFFIKIDKIWHGNNQQLSKILTLLKYISVHILRYRSLLTSPYLTNPD